MVKVKWREKPVREHYRDISIRTAFMLYVVVAAVISTALCSFSLNFFNSRQNEMALKYRDMAHEYFVPTGGRYSVENSENEATYVIFDAAGTVSDSFSASYYDTNVSFSGIKTDESSQSNSIEALSILVMPNYSAKDTVISRTMAVAEVLCIPLFYLSALVICASTFYRRKLKEPIETLDAASERIAENDLDFTIEAKTENELGRLCSSFEKMRRALVENNSEMWRQMEERRRLNAAFSHDLRTPLTVLKGHAAMLASSIPDSKSTPVEAAEEIRVMQTHIARMENYVDAMTHLQRLEDAEIHRRPVDVSYFCSALQDSAQIICRDKAVSLSVSGPEESANIDPDIVMQVCENMLSNSSRHAASAVYLSVFSGDKLFSVTVEDDGPGFSVEALGKATSPFYKGREEGPAHLGLGLNICNILSHRHGGELFVRNSKIGANVTANFSTQ